MAYTYARGFGVRRINTDTVTKTSNMKYIILFCILLFALPGFGQQDSIVYSKGVRENLDSMWFRESFLKIGDSTGYLKIPWTMIDTLVINTLVNERYDAANQYRQAKLDWEKQEKSYLTRLRQPTRQLNELFKKSPDGPRDTIKGKWKLNGAEITIKNDKIGNKRITWYSPDVFEYNKEIFFRRGKRWVSEKSTLMVAN